jgi:hypothetical protein
LNLNRPRMGSGRAASMYALSTAAPSLTSTSPASLRAHSRASEAASAPCAASCAASCAGARLVSLLVGHVTMRHFSRPSL